MAGERYWFAAEQTLIRIRQSPEKQILCPLGRVQLEGQAEVSLGAVSPPHPANGCMTVAMGQSGSRQIRLTFSTHVGFPKNQVSCYNGSSQCQRRASKKDFTGKQSLLTEKNRGKKTTLKTLKGSRIKPGERQNTSISSGPGENLPVNSRASRGEKQPSQVALWAPHLFAL